MIALVPICWESRALYFIAMQLLQLLHRGTATPFQPLFCTFCLTHARCPAVNLRAVSPFESLPCRGLLHGTPTSLRDAASSPAHVAVWPPNTTGKQERVCAQRLILCFLPIRISRFLTELDLETLAGHGKRFVHQWYKLKKVQASNAATSLTHLPTWPPTHHLK